MDLKNLKNLTNCNFNKTGRNRKKSKKKGSLLKTINNRL